MAVTLAGVLAATFLGVGPASAVDPQTRHERDAVNVRILQSEMMVAALSCNLRHQYNAMVGQFEQELVAHAGTLKAMFRRDHGNRAQKALDDYITRLANDASMRSIRARVRFCEGAEQTFAQLFDGRADLAESGLQVVQQAEATSTAAR
jgi:hypothetical protein